MSGDLQRARGDLESTDFVSFCPKIFTKISACRLFPLFSCSLLGFLFYFQYRIGKERLLRDGGGGGSGGGGGRHNNQPSNMGGRDDGGQVRRRWWRRSRRRRRTRQRRRQRQRRW